MRARTSAVRSVFKEYATRDRIRAQIVVEIRRVDWGIVWTGGAKANKRARDGLSIRESLREADNSNGSCSEKGAMRAGTEREADGRAARW